MTKGYPRGLSRGKAQKAAISKLQIPVQGLALTVTSVGAAIGWGTAVLGGLPEGQLKILAVAAQLTFAGSGADANLADTFDGDFGIGSTPADDATIAGADVDLIASTALGAATAEVSPLANAINGVDSVLDNTAADKEVNLNVLIDAADIVDDQSVILTVDGVVEVTFITMLDD